MILMFMIYLSLLIGWRKLITGTQRQMCLAVMVFESLNCLSPEYLREVFVNRCAVTEYSFGDYANKLPVPLFCTSRFTAVRIP